MDRVRYTEFQTLPALQFVSRSRLSTALLAVATLAGPATAETYQLICENPRREYQVRFSDGDANIQLDVPEGSTLYRVLAVEEFLTLYIQVGANKTGQTLTGHSAKTT